MGRGADVQVERPDEGHAGAVRQVPVGRGIEDGEVGPRAGTETPDVRSPQRRRTTGGRRHSASAGVIPISRTASAMQKGIDDE